MTSSDGTTRAPSPDGTAPVAPTPRRPRLTSVVDGMTLSIALLLLFEMPVVQWLERTGRRLRALTGRD